MLYAVILMHRLRHENKTHMPPFNPLTDDMTFSNLVDLLMKEGPFNCSSVIWYNNC